MINPSETLDIEAVVRFGGLFRGAGMTAIYVHTDRRPMFVAYASS